MKTIFPMLTLGRICKFIHSPCGTTGGGGGGKGGDGTPVPCVIFTQDRWQEGESVLSFTHEQNNICSQIQSRPILYPSAYGFGDARVSSGKAKIWLFGPHSASSLIQPKLFASFISTSSRKCCFGIRTEEIQLTALKNFRVSKALVVAAEKIPLNVPNRRFET